MSNSREALSALRMNMHYNEDGTLRSGWIKNFRNMSGTLDYGHTTAATRSKKPGSANIDQLSQKRLIRNYLCDGANSFCVLHHSCECLESCKYGQRYLQTLEERDPPKEKRTKR